MLERSLNENAAPPQRDFAHKSSRLQRSSAIHGNTVYKDVAGKTQNAESITTPSTNIWMNILKIRKMKSLIRLKSMMH